MMKEKKSVRWSLLMKLKGSFWQTPRFLKMNHIQI